MLLLEPPRVPAATTNLTELDPEPKLKLPGFPLPLKSEPKLVRQQGQAPKEEAKVKYEVFENGTEADIAAAKAELAMKKADWYKQSKVTEVEASKVVAILENELQMEVKRKNALRLTKKLKAEQLSRATVQYH